MVCLHFFMIFMDKVPFVDVLILVNPTVEAQMKKADSYF